MVGLSAVAGVVGLSAVAGVVGLSAVAGVVGLSAVAGMVAGMVVAGTVEAAEFRRIVVWAVQGVQAAVVLGTHGFFAWCRPSPGHLQCNYRLLEPESA